MSLSRNTLLSTLGAAEVIALLSPFVQDDRVRRFEAAIAARLENVWLVIENLYDPHNGAALVRTAEAMGLLNVVFIQDEAVKVSRYGSGRHLSHKITIGAERWMRVREFDAFEKAQAFFSPLGLTHIAAVAPQTEVGNDHVAVPRAPVPLDDLIVPPACALWFGNERNGLTQQAVDLAAASFSIPMWGLTQSLNLSVSAGIALTHVCAQVRRRLGRTGDLSPEARQRWLARYLLESVERPESLLRETMSRLGQHWPTRFVTSDEPSPG
jgi:tRNA (guanosine-2'-O-)-methyltransferase